MAVSVRRARAGRRQRPAGSVLLVLVVLTVLVGCGVYGAQSPPESTAAVSGSASPSGTLDGSSEPGRPDATEGEGDPEDPTPTPGGGDGGAAPPVPLPPAPPPPVITPPDPVGPSAPETTSATSPAPEDLESFLADCERGIRDWRAAQVDYPAELSIEKGGTESYVVAVDASDTPLDPSEAIPGPSPTGEAVFVRCEVAARLTPLGSALTVDDDEWIVRSFTPTGVIRWTWVVTAVEADDQELELELQPAVRSEDGTILVGQSSTEISSFITRVRVEEDTVERVGEWWESRWAIIALVAAGIGAAVLALLRFGAQLAEQTRRTVAAFRGGEGKDHGPEPPDTV